MQHIHLHFDSGCGSSESLSRIHTLLTNLNERQEALMTVVQLANQKLDQLKGAIDHMKERVRTDIDYMKTRLNSGEPVSVGDLDALEAKFNNLIANVDQVDPIPEVPTPEAPAEQAQPVAEPGHGGITNEPIATQAESAAEPVTA